MWSIRRPHTDNIKNSNKWDEIRKRIPKDLTSETINYIYETKSNGGCGKVIGEFRVSNKIYIYAEIDSNGTKHLYNTAFIMSALSDEDLFSYLYDGKENGGWALRISNLVIYDTLKDLGEFRKPCDYGYQCKHCDKATYKTTYFDMTTQSSGFVPCNRTITRPFQSWGYVEEV